MSPDSCHNDNRGPLQARHLRFAQAVLCATALSTMAACTDSTVDTFGAIEDCQDVCSSYGDCLIDIDVPDCIDRCENMVDSADGGMAVVEQCAGCLEGMTCSGAVECADDCPVADISLYRDRS